jgi:hypothetical protein
VPWPTSCPFQSNTEIAERDEVGTEKKVASVDVVGDTLGVANGEVSVGVTEAGVARDGVEGGALTPQPVMVASKAAINKRRAAAACTTPS